MVHIDKILELKKYIDERLDEIIQEEIMDQKIDDHEEP